MLENRHLQVFVQEEDRVKQLQILEEMKSFPYTIQFFPKEYSVFDLFQWNPDIVIPDYQNKEIIKCYEWLHPTKFEIHQNHWN